MEAVCSTWKGMNMIRIDLVDNTSSVKHVDFHVVPVTNDKDSYLVACVFYATLFDKNPVGLPSELKKGDRVLVRIAPDEAKMLQEIAWQAVQEMKHHEAVRQRGLEELRVWAAMP
jgi:hypothetical protein